MSLTRLAVRRLRPRPPRLLATEVQSSVASARSPHLTSSVHLCAPSVAPSFSTAPRPLCTAAAGALDGKDHAPAAHCPSAAEGQLPVHLCYDHKSFTRKLVLDTGTKRYPVHVEVLAPDVRLRWKSGHESLFHGRWLHDAPSPSRPAGRRGPSALWTRSCGDQALPWMPLILKELMEDEATLFKWLVSLEKKGITLIKNTPQEPKACFSIVNKVGFVKPHALWVSFFWSVKCSIA
ncbi:gamma-butyrobetaine dioxygenase [Penaeus vannamei]|uniref:Gamma-butyrobetaine dioxygenase n=1 Tax=Penaeus vannamei TaxID=6689 RepID=A0A423SZQ0_PENVA|nr:gamma-butyrobetaine dioxygenase [Penaeus vannamei]